MKEELIPSKETNSQVVVKLKNYLKKGFLLHGSKVKVDVLEPRQSADDDPNRVVGKQNAIYAETHDIRIPIVMALFDMKDKNDPFGIRTEYHSHGDGKLFEILGRNYTFTPGYIYVLPPDTFEVEKNAKEREFISRKAIRPVEVLRIEPSILDEFPV